MIELAVAGASGRMGRCTLELASRDERFVIAAALTDKDCPSCGSRMRLGDQELRVTRNLETPCDVLIDFTTAPGTMAWLDVCKQLKIPMVIGATGHDDAQLGGVREAADIMPIVKAVNFSIGVQLILEAAGRLARELGEDYDIEVTETHHRDKIDAPSGTALAIVDEILRTSGRIGDDRVVFGRHGETGVRPRGQIGVHSLRLGETVGQHEVHFSGSGETITLGHTVHSRETFAAGALRAAVWVIGKKPGLYSLRDTIS